MNEDKFADTLHNAFDDVQVGPAPLARMHADARRIRRTRFTAVASAAAVVVAMAGIGTWRALNDGDAATDIPSGVPSAPAGREYVGVDGVLVAVPDTWVRMTGSATRYCGTETRDVIAFNAPDCGKFNQDAVHFFRDRPADLTGWEQVEIDGERAHRQEVRVSYEERGDDEPTVWTGQLVVNDVVVSVISSQGEREVEALLDSVEITSSD